MKVLVVYDGTHNARDVLRYGLSRLQTLGGELKVLHAFDSAAMKDFEGFDVYAVLKNEAALHLGELQGIIDDSEVGKRVDLISCERGLERELVDIAEGGHFDLILVPQKFAEIARESLSRMVVVPKDVSTIMVLIVDDEVTFAAMLSEHLDLLNFKTDVATRGEQAIKMIAVKAPDVVLLDLRMPDMDGLDVLKNIKATDPEIQVIIVSGQENPGDREEAMRYGAFDFVRKPVDTVMLVRKIRQAYCAKIERPAAECRSDQDNNG